MCKTKYLDYNYNDIKPFLCRPITNPKGLIHGEAIYETDVNSNGKYYYHVTNLNNFKSILVSGLKSSQGGTNGCGDQMAGGRFRKHESGMLFATASPKVVDGYIYNYDAIVDGEYPFYRKKESSDNKDAPIGSIPILLRFKPQSSETWIKDRKQKDAVMGQNNIAVSRLDFLSYEGWISLNTQKAQNTVLSIVSDLLQNVQQ